MSKKRQILKTGLTILISVFLVSAFVNATTTVGDDVSVGGTLGVTGATTLSSTVTVGGKIIAGTSGTPITIDTAGTKFVSIYTDSGATSGDARGIYNRLYLTGAGGGGESLRSYTDIVGVAAANAYGAHISLGMGESTTGGAVTGLGVGVRATLGLPDVALAAGGTYAAIMPEIYSFGANSDAGAVTELSFIRVVNGGNATGMATVDDDAFLFSLQGFTDGTGNLLYDPTLKIKVGTGTRYLVTSVTENKLDLGAASGGIVLANDATIVNTTDVLTITEPTITLAGATKINLDGPVDVSGDMTFDTGGTTMIGSSVNFTTVLSYSGTATTGIDLGDNTTTGIDIGAATTGIALTGVQATGIDFQIYGGASSVSGLLMGGGTAGDPLTTAAADAKFIEFRAETTAGSGDNRLAYLRYALEGAGGGESLRSSTVVNANVGTAHGAHFGIEFEAGAGTSECSGLGVGLRGTLMIPNIASWAPTGTYAGGMFEIYSEGADSDPAGMTELSVLRLVNSGDATGAADVDTDAFLFSIQGFSSGSGSTFYVGAPSSLAASLKVKVGSTTYYLPLYTTQ